jgi:hypothetical protein
MNKKASPFVENISEATMACLVTMVQGNVFTIGVSHLIIAAQTGILAGTLAAVALLLLKTDKRYFVALILGVVTAVVDYLVHPGMIGSAFTEAIITGAGAAALSFIVGFLIERLRKSF